MSYYDIILFRLFLWLICSYTFYEIMSQKRGKRASQDQMETLINFIKNNPKILTGKCHPLNAKEIQSSWIEITDTLNTIDGARKDMEGWKKFFSEWKSKTKKKARINRHNLTVTGGGSYICSDLTPLENRLLSAVGWVTVCGNEKLPAEIDPDVQIEVVEVQHLNEDEEMTESDIQVCEEEMAENVNTPVRVLSKKKKIIKKRKSLLDLTKLVMDSNNKLAENVERLTNAIGNLTLAIEKLAK